MLLGIHALVDCEQSDLIAAVMQMSFLEACWKGQIYACLAWPCLPKAWLGQTEIRLPDSTQLAQAAQIEY